MEDDHDSSHRDAFNVDPENLPSIPCVEQVVGAGGHRWQVNERNLEQCVPIHALVVLHTV